MKSRGLRAREYLQAHRRWGIVALLFFIALVNNLDRQTLSVLAPTLRETFGFGAVEYSYVVASFLAAYAIGYTFCGAVLDRFGVKLGLAVALGFWSLAGMFHAAAAGWISLAILRFLLGLGESFNSPAGVKAGACTESSGRGSASASPCASRNVKRSSSSARTRSRPG